LKREFSALEEDDEEINKLREMRKRAKQKTDEKIAIAEQTLELVESFVRKIDTVCYFVSKQ
jgi:DeoR/GlpR family transcriptional regulator of sugar metabolism